MLFQLRKPAMAFGYVARVSSPAIAMAWRVLRRSNHGPETVPSLNFPTAVSIQFHTGWHCLDH